MYTRELEEECSSRVGRWSQSYSNVFQSRGEKEGDLKDAGEKFGQAIAAIDDFLSAFPIFEFIFGTPMGKNRNAF